MTLRLFTLLALLAPIGFFGPGFQDDEDDGGDVAAEADGEMCAIAGEAVLLMNFDEESIRRYHRLSDKRKKDLKRVFWAKVHETVDLGRLRWTNILIETDEDGHKPEPEVIDQLEGLVRRDLQPRDPDDRITIVPVEDADPDAMCTMYSQHHMPRPVAMDAEPDTERRFIFWGDCRHCYVLHHKTGGDTPQPWVEWVVSDETQFPGIAAQMIVSLEWKFPFSIPEPVSADPDDGDDGDGDDGGD